MLKRGNKIAGALPVHEKWCACHKTCRCAKAVPPPVLQADFGLDGGEEAGGHGGVEVGRWHIERARHRLRPQVLRAHNPRAEAASAPLCAALKGGTVYSHLSKGSILH